jgi:hypothetical protein
VLLAAAGDVVGARLLDRLPALRAEMPKTRPAKHVVVSSLSHVPVPAHWAVDQLVVRIGIHLQPHLHHIVLQGGAE